MIALVASALAWTCPEPPPSGRLVLQTIGTLGSANARNTVEDLLPEGGGAWVYDVATWRREVERRRTEAVATLHADDLARLDAALAGAKRPADLAAVEACLAEGRGIRLDAKDASLVRWLAAEEARAGHWWPASAWLGQGGQDALAAAAAFRAGGAGALAKLDDDDGRLERADLDDLAAWLAANPRHPRAPVARTLRDCALADAERWDEVADPALSRLGLRVRAWQAGPDGGAYRDRLALVTRDDRDTAAQLAAEYEAVGRWADRWRWLEIASGGLAGQDIEAWRRFDSVSAPIARVFRAGGVDIVLAGGPVAVRDEASLRAELATLGATGTPSERAAAAVRELLLAGELARVADDDDARGEALFRIAEGYARFTDAWYAWPLEPIYLVHSNGLRGDVPWDDFAHDIALATLAHATRTLSWGPWTDRTEDLLRERWPLVVAQRVETAAPPAPEPLPFAGPGL